MRTAGSELNGKCSAFGRLRDGFDPSDLLLRAEGWVEELRFDRCARFPGYLLKNLLLVAVNEWVAVAHEYGKRYPHPHIRGGAGNFLRFLDRRHGPVKAGVVRHHRARAPARRASESGESAEIGVDRGHRGEAEKPGLERLGRPRQKTSARGGGRDHAR